VRRTGLDRRALRHLAEAGAFDAFFPHEPNERRRRAALWAVLAELRGEAGPLAPAAAPGTPGAAQGALPASVPPMGAHELTEADYRMTGIPFNGHPMRHLRGLMRENGVRTARELQARGRDGEQVGVAGLVICRQRPGTAKGFVFLSLEDETGIVNVVVTPRRFERDAALISTEPLLLVRGVLQVEQRVVNVRGARFTPLRAAVGAEHVRSHDFH
jgi:error-prone DNA polymerase